MIALVLGTAAGRWAAAGAALVVALAAFGAWQRHAGSTAERARVERADTQAAEQAREAERDFHGSGGAAGRMRDGTF